MIIASNNKGKILQIKEILPNYDLKSLKESGINIDVEETGETFKDNSYLKAKAIYDLTHDSVIADDSGLCIDYFDGWPGVKTHRFLGENSTYIERNAYILDKMKDLKGDDRKCYAECVITLIDKLGNPYTFVGRMTGHIALFPRGDNNFGFDEIFELDNGKTLAELTNEQKYKVIARGKAMEQLKQFVLDHPDINI